MKQSLFKVDKEMAKVLRGELKRQQDNLVLIPSENYVSQAVLEAQGCIMTNKYAEGYPGKRLYNGCRYVDEAENLAIERAKKLFGGDYVNVQPHSGTQANEIAYYALLEPGDAILGMPIDQGGHLTHGLRYNFSGRYYRAHFYGVDKEDELIDYDEVLKIAKRCRPKLIITGASAYPRIIDFKKFKEIADKVGAYLLADIAHIAGLVVAGLHPNPVPYCDLVTSTTHKTLRGPRGAFIIGKKRHANLIDRAVCPGLQGGPFMHVIAAKAVAFKEAMTPDFKKYQKQIVQNAKILAEALQEEGFRLVSGGTDNHLMLLDLRNKGITGREAANILEESGIIVNKNVIPYDERSATITSGIRPGTPAVTTRGMKVKEMRIIARLISKVLNNPDNKSVRKSVRREVKELCQRFPIYENLE